MPCVANAWSETKSILRLDPYGHYARIWDVVFYPLENLLITAGNDKTIRVWKIVGDRSYGKPSLKNRILKFLFRDFYFKKLYSDIREERKILGEIGDGSEGMVYAIALSPDGKYLAAGGFFTYLKDGKVYFPIRIYEFKTGKLKALLFGHTNTVEDLCFSPDGKYLISASSDWRVIVWDVKKLRKVALYWHNGEVYSVASFYQNGDLKVVSAGWDKAVRLFSLRKKTIERTIYLKNGRVYANSIAISEPYGLIAVAYSSGDEGEVDFFDFNLNFKDSYTPVMFEFGIDFDGSRFVDVFPLFPIGVSFSPSGRYLVIGTLSFSGEIIVYDVKKKTEISKFNGNSGITQAVTFLSDDVVVSAGKDEDDRTYKISLWDAETAEPVVEVASKGETIWSVGIADGKIAWGTNSDNQSVFEKFFDFKEPNLPP